MVYLPNIKLYACLKFPKNWKGKTGIHTITLEEHLNKFNALNDKNEDVNKLRIFLNEDEAKKYFDEINK
mgnify:FL=1|tara:strand:+ start:81 stop:287 length:207 start_codon:yes stop_codon:yes gene_type:complete